VPDERRAIEVAERLLASFDDPIRIGDTEVRIGASIGIAFDTSAMQSVDDLLGDADIAMYRAKAAGKRRFHVFRAGDVEAGRGDEAWLDRPLTVRRSDSLRLPTVRLEPNAG
jgi:predicted signal transduction protein with EAL and GGDEF domain